MKKFILKILSFLGLFTLFVFAILIVDYSFIGNQHLGNYQASLLDKVNRLQSIDEPKIILIGDSNLSFGVDSAQIEEAFDMPVVNMGLHGGLGNAFHENMVKLGISKGDIVIICHSGYADDDTILDPALALITIEKHKELWPLVRAKDWWGIIRAYPDYFKDALIYKIMGEQDNVASDITCYSRSAFNQYGDIIKRPGNNTYEFTENSVPMPQINDICINRINSLNEYVKKQEATLLIAGFPIGYGEYTPSAAEYDSFEAALRESVNCDVISHYTDYFIPYNFFYNTNLHLTKEGADIRTRQLIRDIQNWKAIQDSAKILYLK